MKNLIKKLILWINENPKTCLITALTCCIPVAIFSFLLEWKTASIIFSILASFGALFWLSMVAALIIYGLDKLWKRIVTWAQR